MREGPAERPGEASGKPFVLSSAFIPHPPPPAFLLCVLCVLCVRYLPHPLCQRAAGDCRSCHLFVGGCLSPSISASSVRLQPSRPVLPISPGGRKRAAKRSRTPGLRSAGNFLLTGRTQIWYTMHSIHKARLAQLVVRLIRNEQVGGSSPLPGSKMAGVDQLVRSTDCDSVGCGFESRLLPQT